MTKVYKKLTKEQKTRGVIFSSTLSVDRIERLEDTMHEVFFNDKDQDVKISRLLNDSFFIGSHFIYNIIRK